jgi:hypothetical protein
MLSRSEYGDFGPTLASEHLGRVGIVASRETVRKWMLGAGLWRSRPAKIERIHTWRERRASFGELVLMDTSEHDWLEDRGPKLYLIAMIDDATSRLWARFVEHDSTEENLRTLRGWLEQHGRPLALYTDKGSVFVTTRPRSTEDRSHPLDPTSFNDAVSELRIEWIAAHSPQAKGRVERLFGTLQDRLLKELRIAKIRGLANANQFLREVFIPAWEKRFTLEPRSRSDAHRSIAAFDLDSVLSLREMRTVTRDYTVSLRRQHWAISRRDIRPGLRLSRVVVEMRLDGTYWVRFRKARLRPRVRYRLPGYALQPLPHTNTSDDYVSAISPPSPPRIIHGGGPSSRGPFYLAEKGTFLLCVDTGWLVFDKTLRRSLKSLFRVS